jgi:hypothetical protein
MSDAVDRAAVLAIFDKLDNGSRAAEQARQAIAALPPAPDAIGNLTDLVQWLEADADNIYYLDPDAVAALRAALRPAPALAELVEALVKPDVAEIESSGKRWHGEDHRVVSVRWEPYKPDGAQQMKAKGRWQEQVGIGDYWRWQNCDRPTALAAAIRKGGS